MHQEPHSSEHYHAINYGIGGQIEVHVDHWGPGTNPHPGGSRLVTFLGYLTQPQEGGFTVFPQLALRIEPEAGSALFWLTAKTDDEFDSRMFHMGCPVAVGHKWLLTKWIYSDDQMWNHPCDARADGGHNYPVFSNDCVKPITL